MSQLQERIAQFQKMASDDPDNELGHFRLGNLYMEAQQYEDAIKCFRRTLEISPQFSKVYQLLGASLMKLGRNDEAIAELTRGYQIADERGDNLPREEIGKLLAELGQPIPETKRSTARPAAESESGFRCHRPGCPAGRYARQLPAPPMNDDVGRQVYEKVCADCWNFWLRDLSIKVINEMRLDLSTERGAEMYDQIMKETLGLDT